jgi:hypothetical protein
MEKALSSRTQTTALEKKVSPRELLAPLSALLVIESELLFIQKRSALTLPKRRKYEIQA